MCAFLMATASGGQICSTYLYLFRTYKPTSVPNMALLSQNAQLLCLTTPL